MAISARLKVEFSADQTGSNDFGGPDFEPRLQKVLDFVNGTGGNQADILFADTRTIAASSNDDIDLAGVLAGAFGATIAAAEIVGIIVVAHADNINDIKIGAGSNTFNAVFGADGDIMKVKPGGLFLNFAPDANGLGAVVAATGDILRIANGGSGTAVTYELIILARSA